MLFTRPRTRVVTLALSSTFALSLASTAFAADPAAAQVLFDNGKRLMSQRQYPEACTAFAESQKLDPGMGTLFHLADCEERRGRTATAWAAFLEVGSEAHAHGEAAREATARARAAALESRVGRLAVEPGAERATPGLIVARDGEVLGVAQWAIEVPVDPGEHVIEARAPGKGTWRTTVTVGQGAHTLVTVPLLADVPPAQAVAQTTVGMDGATTAVATTQTTSGEESITPHHRGTGQRVAGVVIGVAGLAGLGVGTYFGATSLSRHQDSATHCNGNVCDATGLSYRNDARQDGDIATVALAAGGAALVAGIITYLTAPHTEPASAVSSRGRPVVAVGPGGMSLSGTW